MKYTAIKYDFILVTPGRSGSEHLRESLNNCEGLWMDDEVFNMNNHQPKSFISYIQQHSRYKLLSWLFNRDKTANLPLNIPLSLMIHDFLNRQNRPEKADFQGCKITLDQLFAKGPLLKALLKSDCKIIYLYRQNRLEQVLSLIKARETGIYHSYTPTKPKKYAFNIQEIVKNLKQLQYLECKFLSQIKKHPVLITSYEELFIDYTSTLSSILGFIDPKIPFPTSISKLQPTNREDLSNWVEDYNKILAIATPIINQWPKI